MKYVPSESGYKDPFIMTQAGKFRLAEPTFEVNAIAHALAQTARFGGHLDQFYSVAQHSIFVGWLMDQWGGDAMEGLLHDVTEYVLTDVPAPFKQMLPDWQKIDKDCEKAMREHFKLPPAKSELCQKADWYALFIEAYLMLPGQGDNFEDPNGLRDEAIELAFKIPTVRMAVRELSSWRAGKKAFLDAYNVWSGEINQPKLWTP